MTEAVKLMFTNIFHSEEISLGFMILSYMMLKYRLYKFITVQKILLSHFCLSRI